MWLTSGTPRFREGVWPALEAGQRDRIERFAADVLRYNRAQNLISRREPEARLAALVEECIAAGSVIAARGYLGGSWADAGSGAGFPGILLACLHPAQSITLLERRQGRCDFLRREIRMLGLRSVQVFEGDILSHPGKAYDLVLAKALAPPGGIETLCGALLRDGGTLAVFGRLRDRPAPGWLSSWSDPLPGEDTVLRGLVRDRE